MVTRKSTKKVGAIKAVSKKEIEDEVEEIEEKFEPAGDNEYEIKASKAITTLKKGDKISIDGTPYEVDAHYVLIDHGSTKEMALEVFDAKNDKDFQLRYFNDQVERTLELYELQEIMYIKKPFKRVEW